MRLAAHFDQGGQCPSAHCAVGPSIGHQRHAFARALIDDAEAAKASTADQIVRDEGERPALARAARQHRWSARVQRPFPALKAAQAQPFFKVDVQRLLLVVCDALPHQRVGQTTMADPATLRSQLAQPCRSPPSSGLVAY